MAFGFVLLFPFLMTFWLITFMIYILVKICLYILNGIGLSKSAKNNGYNNSYFAWIPIFNQYLYGKMAINKKIGILFFCSVFIRSIFFIDLFVIKFLPYFGEVWHGLMYVYILAIFVFDMIITNKFYYKIGLKSKAMTILTVLSFGTLKPFLIFFNRNKKIDKLKI